jgi:2-succinyl-5-enolpyruvyl-6-hydroxy-3-cyclohexene-1-carboxylate synthase
VNVQATFAATLVDEWARCGITDAVISPGSRSTPLVLALAAEQRMRVHVRLDERSAGFFALGLARGTGRAVLVVTTSGTAAAELHAAVLEAHHARVALIVCTADRPPERHGVGSPQTVNQSGLFGDAVRGYLEPGVAQVESQGGWRSLAARVVANATHHPAGAGPVHLNLAFREPLVGDPGALPAGRSGGRPWLSTGGGHSTVEEALLERVLEPELRGVIVAGAGCNALDDALELGDRLSWPVLADPLAWPRRPSPALVTSADLLLRSERFATSVVPEVVVHLGDRPASRVVAQWLASAAATHVVVDARWPFADPDLTAAVVVQAKPDEFTTAALAHVPPPGEARALAAWAARWRAADQAAQRAVASSLDERLELTEPGVARALYRALPQAAALFVASSMPVRDLEWFAAARDDPPVVFANRGANGIDGTVSTALGLATSRPGLATFGLLGDLAFLHDLSGLMFGEHEAPAATLVVIDNAGGGIFSFLAQASTIAQSTFERLFGTPQRSNIAALAAAAGCEVTDVGTTGELAGALAAPTTGGIRVLRARTDRARNVEVHAEIQADVGAALEASLD